MIIQPPERSAPASRHADWLEIRAIVENDASIGELRSVLRIDEDRERHRYDPEADELVEEEILQSEDERIVDECARELERRARGLGAAYPFALTSRSSGSRKQLTIQLDVSAEDEAAQYTYLLCLIISAIRLDIVALEVADCDQKVAGKKLFSEHRYGYLLQICASVALGGYLLGDVVSFGFPRPNKTRFLTAHSNAWKRFGAYQPVAKTPQGLSPNIKDAGIDLIGWVHFPDQLAAKTLVFGQVASGLDWIGKPVGHYVDRLKHWFLGAAFTKWTEMLAIPFNITDAGNFIEREGADELRAQCFVVEESTFGIVFDRDRLASAVDRYSKWGTNLNLSVDRSQDAPQVKDWVQTVTGEFKQAA